MRLLDLFEAPIEDFTQVGDWSKNSSFKDQDRKLLNNPKAVVKIISKWDKTPVPFNIVLVNNADARKHSEVGFVTKDWLQQNMPRTVDQIPLRSDAINVIFTGNTASEKVPMTAWIMAHRLGHAFAPGRGGSRTTSYDMKEALDELHRIMAAILNDGYGFSRNREIPYDRRRADSWDNRQKMASLDRTITNFYTVIGTMRSAREHNLRDMNEFVHELLAQYMLTGSVKFNPLPMGVKSGKDYFTFHGPKSDLEYYNNMLEDLAEQIGYSFLYMLTNSVGRILVM